MIPWVEKYRPSTLGDVKGHEDIMNVLKRYGGIQSTPNLLFYGPPGTGKTSTILAMARDTFGDQLRFSVMELNASDERGIDTVIAAFYLPVKK